MAGIGLLHSSVQAPALVPGSPGGRPTPKRRLKRPYVPEPREVRGDVVQVLIR